MRPDLGFASFLGENNTKILLGKVYFVHLDLLNVKRIMITHKQINENFLY